MVFSTYKIQRAVEFVDQISLPEHSVKTLQHLSSPVEAFIGRMLTVIVGGRGAGGCFDSSRRSCRLWRANNFENATPVLFGHTLCVN